LFVFFESFAPSAPFTYSIFMVLFAPPLLLFKNLRPEFEPVFDCSDNLGFEKKK
jgi:hypothetical protein